MEYLKYEVRNNVGYLTLNNPTKLNALQSDMKAELHALLREIRTDLSVRCLVITGEGRAFCAGGDVSSMGDKMHFNDGRQRMKYDCDWAKELNELEKPVIAAVNGYAFGAGLSIALACDYILCSEKGSFACSFVNVGLVPDSSCAWNLPKRIGIARAKEMAFSGRTVRAPEALQIGLADRIVAPEELMPAAIEMAEKWAAGPTYTIGMTKQLINRAYSTGLNEFLDIELGYQAASYQTSDHKMAVKAFLEKGEKHFEGF